MDIEIKKKQYLIPRRYWPWLAGGLVLTASLVGLALSNYSSTLRIDGRGLNISEVTRGRFNDFVSLDGRVIPSRVVQISPEEGGLVAEKVVEEGSRVRRGDVILRLTNANLDLEILNAESELAEKQNMLRNTQISMEQEGLSNSNEKAKQDMEVERARRVFEQKKSLFAEQLISREEYIRAREDYELARRQHANIGRRLEQDARYRRNQLDQMNDNLDNMRRNVELVRRRKDQLEVRSAIDGEIGTLNVVIGQSIAPGQNVGQISDLTNFKVTAQVDESYIDRVTTGLTATFTQGSKSYSLRVSKVYPEVKDSRFRIDMTFVGNRPANIRSGQTYYIDLRLGEARNAILIPKGTFFSTTGGQWIFVVDKDGKRAYRRNIRIGRQNPQYYEVIEGLEPGERVIVSGYERYRDNEVLIID